MADDPTLSRRSQAAARGIVAEARMMLPLGTAGLVGVSCFLGPYVMQSAAVESGGVARFVLACGRFRWPLVLGAAALLVTLLRAVGRPNVETLLESVQPGLRVVLKLTLAGPLLAALALLLAVVVAPVMAALSSVGAH